MKTGKSLLLILIMAGMFGMSLFQQNSYSQSKEKQIKKEKIERLKSVNSNSQKKMVQSFGPQRPVKSFKKFPNQKNSSMGSSYILFEDFESGIYPPTGWDNPTVNFESWEHETSTSGYGIGDYCTKFNFYWNCNGGNPEFISPSFSGSSAGDTLFFDFAYAPYDNGSGSDYDDLEIYYSNDNGTSYFSLEYIPGLNLQTSPATTSSFFPETYEWGTYYIILPTSGITNISFKAWEFCGNNLYIDNIKVSGDVIPVTDIAVTAAYSKGRFPRTFLTNDTISANLKNVGNQNGSNVKVYMRMTGTSNQFDSTIVPFISPSSNYVVKFKPFTPVLNGNSSVKIWVEGGDEDINNDTARCITNVNSNYFAYADTTDPYNQYNTLGFYDHVSILQKFRVTNANSRITEVKLKIPSLDFGGSPIGQGVRGIVLDQNGNIVARSDEYTIKTTDTGKFVALKLTNPRPYYPLINDSYFYVGADYSEPVGDEYFWNLLYQYEEPARPDCFFLGLGATNLDIGENVYRFEWGNKFGIEAKIENMPSVDAGISSLGNLYDQYYSSTSAPMAGKVFNNALSGTASGTVIRKITPGSYTSSMPVSIPANSTVAVTFANFTFVSGTNYIVRDSVILSGDVNTTNNSMSREFKPRIAKDLVVIYQKDEDKDTLVRAILNDGRYAGNYDVINLNYKGSYRPWKIIFNCTKSGRRILEEQRDSLKSFLDASTPGNKKSLIVFNDNPVNFENEYSNPADSIFLRQYMRAKYVSYNWLLEIPNSDRKFKGKGFFSGVSQDSVGEPMFSTAQLIKPTNGSSAAFVPKSVTGTGSDSAIAVSFAGANYNTFFMSNRISDLRATNASPMDGPVLVYTKIIDWLQSISTGAKALDLTVIPEGLYDANTNSMTSDTVRVNIRNSTSPFAIVESKKVNLNSAGQASIMFNSVANGVNYYIQIIHRNSMVTWSGTPQMFAANHLTYDFTTASGKAYGNNMKLLGSKWTIYSGDVTDLGTIDATDISAVDLSADMGESGYVINDLNNDYFVDATDISLCDNNVAIGVYLSTPGPSPSDNSESVSVNISDISIQSENKIDHEIYEKTKNMQPRENILKDRKYNIFNNGRIENKNLK